MGKPLSNKLTEEAKSMFENMPPPLFYRLNLLAEGLGIPISDVILNLLIDQWARTITKAKIEGKPVKRPLPEFAKEISEDGTQKLITGEALFKYLIEFYEEEFKQLHKGINNSPAQDLDKLDVFTFTDPYLITAPLWYRPVYATSGAGEHEIY